MEKAKSFEIPKRAVWEAYKKVKAKKGAAGIDEISIDDFEKDLGNNLYKLWNRMSSGTYFPPPVKAVAIPKKSGGGQNTWGPDGSGQNSTDGGERAFRAKSRTDFFGRFIWV